MRFFACLHAWYRVCTIAVLYFVHNELLSVFQMVGVGWTQTDGFGGGKQQCFCHTKTKIRVNEIQVLFSTKRRGPDLSGPGTAKHPFQNKPSRAQSLGRDVFWNVR